MPRRDLTDTLRDLVIRHGTSAVLHSLAEIQSTADRPASASASARKPPRDPSKQKPYAMACISRMALAAHKTHAMTRAAELFDNKRFLPAISDIREFSRVHGIELPRTASRSTSVPRIFAFLASMDTDAIVKTLDEGSFSGPTRLAPIADAIRSHVATRRHDRPIADKPPGEPVAKQPRKEPTPST